MSHRGFFFSNIAKLIQNGGFKNSDLCFRRDLMWNIYFSLIFKYTTRFRFWIALFESMFCFPRVIFDWWKNDWFGRSIPIFRFNNSYMAVGLSAFSVCGFGSSLSIVLLCFQRSKVSFDVVYIIIPKGAIFIGLKLQFEWFLTFFK